MIEKSTVREIMVDFHQRTLPDYTRRMVELACPENKIRCLTGVRRAGKTFSFYQLIDDLLKQNIEKERILYINFEDERLLPISTQDFSTILNTYYETYPAFKDEKIFVFFDEIQNIPQWEKFIRRIHDSENIQINLTGSSSSLLSREIASALRGRTLSYEIFPFGFPEFLQSKNISANVASSKDRAKVVNAFEIYLHCGGFPEVIGYSEEFRLKTLQEYFNLILYKDLVERYEIRNHALIKYLLRFLLANNANPFSVNKFYNDSKSQGYQISKDTIHNYLSYLEDAYCFSLVPKFSESIRARQVNYRKIYAIDHGLVTATTSSRSFNTGRLLETMVYNKLRWKYQRDQIFYYRTSGGEEIDFLTIKRGVTEELIQVCERMADTFTKNREVKALILAMEELGVNHAHLITRDQSEKLSEGGKTIFMIPFYIWALGESKSDYQQ